MEKISLEQRIQILEDKEAIKDVTYYYASYVNQGWDGIQINPSALLDIFTENAIWGSTIMTISVSGVQNIIESLKQETKAYCLPCTSTPTGASVPKDHLCLFKSASLRLF